GSHPVTVEAAARAVLRPLDVPVGPLTVTGSPPMLPSCFPVDLAAAAVVGATSLAAAALWRLRGDAPAGPTGVDVRHAAAALRSERYLRVASEPPVMWAELSGDHRTSDGWVLAAHGADVLRVGADHLALVPPLVVDTGFGKRFCHLDLRTGAGRDVLQALVADADVLVQAYRPGALDALGFGPRDCAALRPGLV